MDPSKHLTPSRPSWAGSRPAQAPDGPPGLAALVDAERSALREYHERLRALADAERAAVVHDADVQVAIARQRKAVRGTPGMRDRMRTSEHDARFLLADVRRSAAVSTAAAEAARFRALAAERRLEEIRQFVDDLATGDEPQLESIRRGPTLPTSARRFPSIGAFVADRPARARGDRRIEDLVGRPLGERWALEDPEQPWATTRWRAAWSCDGADALGEIYAVELVMRAHPVRRVLLLGAASAVPGTAHVIESMLTRQGERNSLAALAAAAASVS